MVLVITGAILSVAAAASKGLKPSFALIASGVTDDPMSVTWGVQTFQNWNVMGALTGLPVIGDEALRFSVPTPVAPMVETMPLEHAAEAHDRMMACNARSRIVLTTGA